MAVEQRVICDRCGAAILENRTALLVQCGPLRPHHEIIDLCLHCKVVFEGFLREFSSEATEATLSSPEPLTAT